VVLFLALEPPRHRPSTKALRCPPNRGKTKESRHPRYYKRRRGAVQAASVHRTLLGDRHRPEQCRSGRCDRKVALCEVAFRPSSTSTSRVCRRSGEALCEVVHDVHDVHDVAHAAQAPRTERRTRGGRRRRSRCTSSCRLIGRETPPPAALTEGRPSGRLPRSSRAVDVRAPLQPTYVVSVVRRGRVNVAGVAVTSTTCQ